MTRQSINGVNNTEAIQPEPVENVLGNRINYEGFITEGALDRLLQLSRVCEMFELLASSHGELSDDKTIDSRQVSALLEDFSMHIDVIRKGVFISHGIFTAAEGIAGLEYIRNARNH